VPSGGAARWGCQCHRDTVSDSVSMIPCHSPSTLASADGGGGYALAVPRTYRITRVAQSAGAASAADGRLPSAARRAAGPVQWLSLPVSQAWDWERGVEVTAVGADRRGRRAALADRHTHKISAHTGPRHTHRHTRTYGACALRTAAPLIAASGKGAASLRHTRGTEDPSRT